MKKNKKIILSITLIIFSFSLFKVVLAVNFKPQVTIPGKDSEYVAGQHIVLQHSLQPIGDYIKAIYNYALMIVGILAAIVLMVGGIIWLTSAGNSEKISQAKSWISGALTGLVLMLISYVILQTINPNLVNLRTPGLDVIGKINKGCCKLEKNIVKNPHLLPSGRENVSLTFTTSGIDCYRKALALGEPGIKPPEELTKEEKNDIEKYLGNKFHSNSVSVGFEKCNKIGVRIYYVQKITTSNYGGSIGPDALVCMDTLDYGSAIFSTYGLSEKFSIFKEGVTCNDLSLSNIIEIIREHDSSILSNYSITDHVFYNAICKEESKPCKYKGGTDFNGKEIEQSTCYDGYCWMGKGRLGEPCGNNGSLCLPTGTNCKKIEGFTGREHYGGRSCGSEVKCCIKEVE